MRRCLSEQETTPPISRKNSSAWWKGAAFVIRPRENPKTSRGPYGHTFAPRQPPNLYRSRQLVADRRSSSFVADSAHAIVRTKSIAPSLRSTLQRCCPSLRILREYSTSGVHSIPVILIRSAAGETDLIVSSVVVESGPGKTVRATSSEDPFQKAHSCTPLLGNPPLPSLCELGLRRFEYRPDSMYSEAYFRP